ncbi:MFS transporter [Sphingomonas pseudosanguinis]|uniref:DHA1 family inner membrane transport protein n=1 Tax=Sphingomonas pseudosanguinis TaxID=413712 RepID=A0A7W6F2X6_9SPHN|nr:MFS transporter [Sphingomonas pseudosanguinis]MBB3879449.1 DHA1 family inner membrane transport protein [Sphingomonas pseudosanguinis]MBN3537106.1 MFS transporter [Sphingomonas pseudosanguinis]
MAKTFSPGVVHAALAVGGFAIGTTEFAAMSLEPDLARGLGIDAPTAGHVISAYALGVVVGAPLLAVLSARLARRTLLIALMLMFAIGNGLSAMAPDYHWMLVFRFLSGLPHGAYFGIAALVAASLVPDERRTMAVGRIMLGLTVATVIGVPLAQMLGQWLNWRWVFGVVAALALLTATLVAIAAPQDRPDHGASVRRELAALGKGQVWLTLAIGAIGFGGMFAVYTYLASTLTEVTGASQTTIPLVLAVFGLGMTIGNIVVPRFADRALMPTAGALLLWSAAMLALYPLAAGSLWTILPNVFAIGLGGALGTVLQTRLMDVAGEGQGLAAALNHSAFNTANAIGPWAGGLAIAHGLGWTSTGYVGCGLALGGFVIWLVAMRFAGDTLNAPADRSNRPVLSH